MHGEIEAVDVVRAQDGERRAARRRRARCRRAHDAGIELRGIGERATGVYAEIVRAIGKPAHAKGTDTVHGAVGERVAVDVVRDELAEVVFERSAEIAIVDRAAQRSAKYEIEGD